jgi:hypothetical protein
MLEEKNQKKLLIGLLLSRLKLLILCWIMYFFTMCTLYALVRSPIKFTMYFNLRTDHVCDSYVACTYHISFCCDPLHENFLYFILFEITKVIYLYAGLNGIPGGSTKRQKSQSGSYFHKPSDSNLPNLPLVLACIIYVQILM